MRHSDRARIAMNNKALNTDEFTVKDIATEIGVDVTSINCIFTPMVGKYLSSRKISGKHGGMIKVYTRIDQIPIVNKYNEDISDDTFTECPDDRPLFNQFSDYWYKFCFRQSCY